MSGRTCDFAANWARFAEYRLTPADEAVLRFTLTRLWSPTISPVIAMLLAEIESLRAELRAAK